MTTLFAFLHHLAAFTLVGALAIEFILMGQATSEQGLSVPVAKRLVKADAVLVNKLKSLPNVSIHTNVPTTASRSGNVVR